MPAEPAYDYACEVVRVIDGDTLVLRVDLGFRMTTEQAFRLYGIDAPELPTPEGVAARDFVNRWVGEHGRDHKRVRTYPNPDKYGRWLAMLSSPLPDDPVGLTLNAVMVANGHARPYDGGKR